MTIAIARLISAIGRREKRTHRGCAAISEAPIRRPRAAGSPICPAPMRTVHVLVRAGNRAIGNSQGSTPSRGDSAYRWLSSIWPAAAAF
jgi:hypothetical protein